MMDPILGQIILFAGNFAPKGWAFCNGQLLSIAQNQALFSLLGTTYGGDGVTTFALPDLRGRAPIHFGQGPGLSNYSLGETAGSETVTLTAAEMPQHNHSINVDANPGTTQSPSGNYPSASRGNDYVPSPAAPTTLNAGVVGQTGGNQPHNNIQPILALNFVIALQGIYPSHS
ncbi:MAG: phage tail protein [Myxococcales bacterium]|nr:phage tail protein [Myxococcales bacterium]